MRIFAPFVATSCLFLMSSAAQAQTVVQSRLFGTVLEYPTTGCGGAVIQTPLPGKQFVTPPANTQASAKRFYAKAAALHAHWLTSMQCTHTGRTHVLVPDISSGSNSANLIASNDTSYNWSGYQIYNTAQYTEAGWTIPTVTRAHPGYSSDGSYYSAIWTGIGGGFDAGSGPLIQAGSSQDITSGGSTHNYFWYEIVGGATDTDGEISISLVSHSGDSAGSVSIWTPRQNGSSSGVAEFGICNFSTTGCVNFHIGDLVNGPLYPSTRRQHGMDCRSAIKQFGICLAACRFRYGILCGGRLDGQLQPIRWEYCVFHR